MESASLHPRVASEYLLEEVSLIYMLSPFNDFSELPPLHINWFGHSNVTRHWKVEVSQIYPTQ